MPRLYREAPLNSIWEGSGNVNALDTLRAMVKSPESVESFFAEVELAAGANDHLDTFVAGVKQDLANTDELEYRARQIVEKLALALQGSLLVRHSPPEVADAFCASRLGGQHGRALGTLPPGVDCEAIVERHRPHV
jgi:putative acyl-CoA dehydrogenase